MSLRVLIYNMLLGYCTLILDTVSYMHLNSQIFTVIAHFFLNGPYTHYAVKAYVIKNSIVLYLMNNISPFPA